jgi:hypothetical protein
MGGKVGGTGAETLREKRKLDDETRGDKNKRTLNGIVLAAASLVAAEPRHHVKVQSHRRGTSGALKMHLVDEVLGSPEAPPLIPVDGGVGLRRFRRFHARSLDGGAEATCPSTSRCSMALG